jgi:hypothetical protein
LTAGDKRRFMYETLQPYRETWNEVVIPVRGVTSLCNCDNPD